MIDDYETIDWHKHYEETKQNTERLDKIEKDIKALKHIVELNKLY